ncbi:MAG: DUF4199 domain-containing protein [Ignavibacteriales bacterium]|nr:DUF4199 domain-containing protein [Ignavibacteriales bacterium]
MVKTRFGFWLGGLVVFWTFVMGISGWYKDPVLLNLFWVVVLLQIGVLFRGLKESVHSRSLVQYIKDGFMISLIGGVIIFAGSMIFTTIVFPHYFEELQILGREIMKAEGKTNAQIEAAMAQAASTQTPFMQALFGFVGTVMTGLIASPIIGLSVRKRIMN